MIKNQIHQNEIEFSPILKEFLGLQSKEFEKAFLCFKMGVFNDPECPIFYEKLSCILIQFMKKRLIENIDKKQEALETLDSVIKRSCVNAFVYECKGLNIVDNVIKTIIQQLYISIHRKCINFGLNFKQCVFSMMEYEEAIECYENAIKLNQKQNITFNDRGKNKIE